MKMRDIEILKAIMHVENQRYHSSGNFSTTEVIDPPRLVCMKKRYAEQIHRDIETQVDALMGTAMHGLFEKNLTEFGDPKYQLEEEVSADFTVLDQTRTLSGRYDILVDRKHIVDVKTAKCWKKIFDPKLISWTEQQNIYAQLLTQKGYHIESISALTIYKDWSMMNAIRDKAYPQEPVEMNRLPLWPEGERYDYIINRLSAHVACEELADTELPVCTPEERWERFPNGGHVQFALFKTDKAKRATKILHGCNSLPEAVEECAKIKGVTKASFIEIRHAERKRCERFCPVADFCDIHQVYMKKKKNNALNEKYPLMGVI
jgi:hypothetical protein